MNHLKDITLSDREVLELARKVIKEGTLIKLDARAMMPMYVTGLFHGSWPGVTLSPLRKGDSDVYKVVELDGQKYEAYETGVFSRPKERKISSIHSVLIDGEWVKLKDALGVK